MVVATGPGASGARSLAWAAPGRLEALTALTPLGLAVCTGVGLHLCLPPDGSILLGWLAPAPLLLAVHRSARPLHAFGLASLAGTVFWALHIRWMLSLPGINLLNYTLSLPVLGALFGLLGPLGWLARWAPSGTRWAALAGAWVLVEYLRLHLGFASTPWGVLAYSQLGLLPLAQTASVAGLLGVSFVVAAGAAGLALAANGLIESARSSVRDLWELLAPALLLVLCLGAGALRLASTSDHEGGLRVAVVQAGLYVRGVDSSSRRRAVLERYEALTRDAAAAGAELIVWPASSVPGSLPFDRGLVRRLGAVARELGRPLLVGASGQPKSSPSRRERPSANSAFLLDVSGEIAQRYDKIQLLPFNEYVPLRGLLDWPDWVATEFIDARSGETRTVFETQGARFGLLICWENLFPSGFRETARQGVDFMVSMTNEAFTQERGAHEQMLVMNTFRAIENGVPVVRAATTGVSGFIDRFGRVGGRVTDERGSTIDAVGFQVAEVPLSPTPTVYGRFGDGWVAVCALGLVSTAWRARRAAAQRRRAPA